MKFRGDLWPPDSSLCTHLGAQLSVQLVGREMGGSGRAGPPQARWGHSLEVAGPHTPCLGWASLGQLAVGREAEWVGRWP